MADCAIFVVWNPDTLEALMEDRPDIKTLSGGNYLVFPGGKVEPGEDYEQAMCREFREELACEVLECEPLMPPFVNVESGWVVAPYLVTSYAGTIPSHTYGDRRAPLLWTEPLAIALLPIERESARVQIANALIDRFYGEHKVVG